MNNEKVLRLAIFALIISSVLPIFFLKIPTVKSATNHVVISEVQIGGSYANDEFVELYNPTETSIDITGWKLKRLNSGGSSSNLVTSISGSIPTHGFFLMAHPTDYTGSVEADNDYSSPSYAITNNNTIILYNDSNEEVDRIGMGSTSYNPEGTYSFEPLSEQSVERKAKETSTSTTMGAGGVDEFLGNGHDTDDNSVDFVERSLPQPQNSSSDIEPVISTPTPEPTETPTPSPSDTPTPEPSESPSPTLEPTGSPTPEPSDTPTPTATPEPTDTPTSSPEPTITPEPTETPEPTDTPEPTPTPTPTTKSMVIGMFLFPRRKTVCTMTYRFYGRGFMRFMFPKISCTRVI